MKAIQRKYNWLDLKQRYITGNITLEQIASQEQMPRDTIFYHSYKEGWPALRKEYNNKVQQRIKEKQDNLKDKFVTNDANAYLKYRASTIKYLRIYIEKELKNISEGKYPVKSREGLNRAVAESIKTLELLEGRPSERTELSGELKGKPIKEVHALILQHLTAKHTPESRL